MFFFLKIGVLSSTLHCLWIFQNRYEDHKEYKWEDNLSKTMFFFFGDHFNPKKLFGIRQFISN